jgi:methyl-accepting chemotaxis protein
MNAIKVKRSLSRSILSIFIIVIILSQLIVGTGTAFQVSQSFISSQKDDVSYLSDQIGISVENYLTGFETIIRALAEQEALKTVKSDPMSEAALLKVLDTFVTTNPDILYLYLGVDDKRMLMKPDDDLGPDYDPTSRDWYKVAKDAGTFLWTDPYFDDTVGDTGAMVITACQPVYDNNKKFIGVIAADIALSTLNAQTKEISIGEKGYPIIVDGNNIIMAHRDPKKIGGELVTKDIKDAIASNLNGVEYTYQENGRNLKKYAAISRLSKVNWSVISTLYYDEIQKEINKIILLIIGASVLALTLAVVLILMFTKRFNKNIQKLIHSMQKARTGDLSVLSEVQSKDEIGVLSIYFDDTLKDLSALVLNIKEVSSQLSLSSQNLAATSEEVSASADEVARTVDDIAKGAQEQANDAEKGAVIAKSLSDRFNELNHYTKDMLGSAERTGTAYSEGVKSVKALEERNTESISANNSIEKVILQLNDRTLEIGAILDTISAISVQTNLLALNASIEAARAGEHGRGFAVVADEIRKLAEQSSKAAEEVKGIVLNIQKDGTESVNSMTTLKSISVKQDEAVKMVITAFETIRLAYEQISNNIQFIGKSVDGVNHDKDLIVVSIENISAVSEETAAASEEVTASMEQQTFAVEEVANAAQELNQISVHLNSEISKFKI